MIGSRCNFALLLTVLVVATESVTGFSTHFAAAKPTFSSSALRSELAEQSNSRGDDDSDLQSPSRRSLLSKAALSSASAFAFLAAPALVASADTGAEVRGIELTPFNGLIFQYRGSEFGGLKGSDLNEPSISYADFMTKLKGGEVEFVEFMAPDGDAAYATIKGEKPVRIGEGYPIERHDGFSSPAFAVRAVKNAGVNYKFTVPALRSYATGSS